MTRRSRAFLSCVVSIAFAVAAPFATAAAAAPAPVIPPTAVPTPTRTLTLRGPATNLTAEVSATVTLVLAIEGEKFSGTMKTEPPLTGSGKISGRFLGGWCELRGQLDEGFQIEFRGAFNERDCRGTYLVSLPGQPLQYGKFQLTRDPPPPPKPDQK